MKNYSQNNEQQIILDFFGSEVGRFLDIGAFDGVVLSNTRALAELGWNGIMVEPRPENLVSLVDSVKGLNRRIDVWSCAVGIDNKPAVLRMTSDKSRLWSTTICDEMPADYIPDPVAVSLYVPTVRIGELLEYGPFDFISLDAEWMDFDILKDAPDSLRECRLFCVETRGPEERVSMVEYMQSRFGFALHAETRENIIMRKP